MELRRFEYVPAAITGRPPNTFIGVKYEDNTDKDYLWKRIRFNGLTTHWCPDRTLYYGSSSAKANAVGVNDFDAMMLMGPTSHPQVLRNAGFRYAMASPHHVSGPSETRRNSLIKYFCDSGGFQLISGALDWVDMDELAEMYNRTIDYGIGLDIPVQGVLQPKYLMRMCEVMLNNNRYLRSQVCKEVEIYDVSHGNAFKFRREFLARVLAQKKQYKIEGGGLAVGGIAQNFRDGGAAQTIVTGTVNLVYVLLKSKGYYERYHILGTTSPFFQLLYHIMLEYEQAPHITADSTSYILPSAYNLYCSNKMVPDHSLQNVDLPKTVHSYTLQCNCPICSLVKYSRELHFTAATNAIHGLYVMGRQRDRIEETALDYLGGRITLHEAVKTCYGGESSLNNVYAAALRFAQHACEKGFEAAWSRHELALKSLMRSGMRTHTLFTAPIQPATPKAQRLDSILTRFEQFHVRQKKR